MIELKLTRQELQDVIVSIFFVRLNDNLEKEEENRLKTLQRYLERIFIRYETTER